MILIDTESRSRADLKALGGRVYWRHPSSEALCFAAYCTDTHRSAVWGAHENAPTWVQDASEIAAHNMRGFDRFALDAYGVAPRATRHDTSEMARTAGFAGALEALGEAFGHAKDREASTYTRSLSATRADGAYRVADAAIDHERVRAYCARDVDVMRVAWPELEQWRDLEPDVRDVDYEINDRGVAFDCVLARVLLAHDEVVVDRAARAAARELGVAPERAREIAASPKQFCGATGAANAQKLTVGALRGPLAELRRALASIARGKLTAGLARAIDGRLYDCHRYYGAHTGRWSGAGMQLQNMPRPAKRFEDWSPEDVARFADAVRARPLDFTLDADAIALLLRATIYASRGRLATCDFSGVEARALAWAAGDQVALDNFRAKRDPYRAMAATIFGCDASAVTSTQRTVGKIAELACGYGMGPLKFDATARAAGQDLAALGVDARQVVYAWRDVHAPIVRFWHDAERAFFDACEGRTAHASVFTFAPSHDGDDAIACVLPSGRPIVYRKPRVSRDERGRPHATYRGGRGETHVYGGLLVENAIQAFCRDLFAHALVRAERAGLNPVLHVHDEIVCDVETAHAQEAYEELQRIMIMLPEWAPGFPVDATGHVGERYCK